MYCFNALKQMLRGLRVINSHKASQSPTPNSLSLKKKFLEAYLSIEATIYIYILWNTISILVILTAKTNKSAIQNSEFGFL